MATDRKRFPLSTFLIVTTAAAAGLLAFPCAAGAQARDQSVQASRKSANVYTPGKVWEDRGPIQNLDLYWGSASADRAPVSPFTLVREDTAATNPKAVVRDAKGVLWGVKWDEEVQGEVAATRLAWAMGLGVEETYYVPTGTIRFAGQRPSFQRLGSFVDQTGRFKAPARFERKDPELVSKGTWTFGKNPVMADPGYAVLVLMDVVMGNWDAKDDNNKILSAPAGGGGADWYLIGDYGACFGKMGGEFSHSKYELKDFAKNPPVITGVSGDRVFLGYKGKNESFHESIPIEGARLFARRVADLRLEQVEDAFRAAHANETDLHGFARAVFDRMQQVVAKVH